MNSRDEVLPTFTAYGQSPQVLTVDPLGVVQHVDHLSEREQRIAVPARGDAPNRAKGVQRDKVERVAAGLSARAARRGRTVLHVRVDEGGYGTLERFSAAEG